MDVDPVVILGGNGVSGPIFVDNAEYRDWVWDTFQADALDMETAAVAHVTYVNDVPFIAFRSLSDPAAGALRTIKVIDIHQILAADSAVHAAGRDQVWGNGVFLLHPLNIA